MNLGEVEAEAKGLGNRTLGDSVPPTEDGGFGGQRPES